MAIFVEHLVGEAPGISAALVKRWATIMLAHVDLAAAELSILLTDDEQIQRLNRDYREKDKPTDVLAFAMAEGMDMPQQHPGSPEILGDVVISLPIATRQAEAAGKSVESEVRMLLAHGLLHLLGYDHQNDEEEAEMLAATKRLTDAVLAQEAEGK